MSNVTSHPDAQALDVDDLTGRLRVGITRLSRKLRYQAASDLTPSQLSALAAVNREGPLTLGHLAEVEHVAPPSITKVVDKLEAQGLVERRLDSDDGRVRRVAVTDVGFALLAETRARKDAWLATRLAVLDPDDLARVADSLDVLERIIRKEPS